MGPFFLFPERAQARLRTLRILQWKHFVPDYDRWFDEVFTKQWGQKHNTKVIVDHVPFWEINARAEAEIKARQGHDLVMFPSPPARYEKHVINHAEIYQAVAGQQGQVVRLGHRSTFNPKTKKYFAFADSYVVAPFNYVKDYWEQIGFTYGPSTYDSLRLGAKQIRDKLGIPCGLGLAAEPDSNIALHGVLWSFGGSVQDARGQVTINSKGTIEALKYVKALYQESGTADLFNWHPDFTDQALLNGRVSCAIHAIGIARHADRETPDVSRRIRINAALRGPEHWLSCAHITSCYAVWEHAQNKEDAKQFLVDLADTLDVAFKVSGFCNFPCFPKMVPDLKVQLENDPTANPPHKYAALQDALLWTMNIGHPGYATAAIDEVFQTFVIPNMFAAVAKGALSPEEAASAAEKEVKRIFEKWDE
jgi:multiple sugar transport system substrate-binding protein